MPHTPSAPRLEEDARSIAVEAQQLLRAHAHEAPGVRAIGDDEGPAAGVEQGGQGTDRHQMYVGLEGRSPRDYVVAREGSSAIAHEHDRVTDVEGEGRAKGVEAEYRDRRVDVRCQGTRRTSFRVGRERTQEHEHQAWRERREAS